MKIHRVILENRHAVQGAVGPELDVTPWKIDVLVSEDQIDVPHVDAPQRGEAETCSAYSGEDAPAPQSLCSLGENRPRRGGSSYWHSPLEPKRLTATRGPDRDVGDAGAEGTGNEGNERRVLGVRSRYEMEAVRLQRGGIV